MEQWRLAAMSFKLWGALSPTKEFPSIKPELSSAPSDDPKKNDDLQKEKSEAEQQAEVQAIAGKRSIGQAEIESAFFKVLVGIFRII